MSNSVRTAVAVDVANILSLVSCADDYGFGDEVFFDGMASMLDYECSDDEIEAYTGSFLTEESRAKGYGEEDCEAVRERITGWRKKYCGTHIKVERQ